MTLSKEHSVPVLEIRNLQKKFGAMSAINDISFEVEQGEIMVIVGGSGCGKTTTLRCIAGLEDLTEGAILLDGKVIASPERSLPPEARGIGMVFQSYALWPHKTVMENVAYGLSRQKIGKVEAGEKVARILKQVGLSGFEHRSPSTLSGGQQQRVALARSAILQPRLLLLDEPLSNLDAKLREQMRDELREMIKMFDMTAVHITHDQAEAMALADRVICMRSGRIEQLGTPRQIYREPANRYVAEFIGASSFLEGEVVSSGEEALVDLGGGLQIQMAGHSVPVSGKRCLLAIRPEAVEIGAENDAQKNSFQALVERAVFLGPHSEYHLDIKGRKLKAYSAADLMLGATVNISIDPHKIVSVNDA
jgi:ABC-type Fe3+/spermidine/putrescine transport system ATPase subunit